MADIKTIAAGCRAYRGAKGVYPQPPLSKNFFSDVAFVPDLAPSLVPAFMAKLPDSDPRGLTYCYGVSPDGKEFVIVSGQWRKKIDPRDIPSQFIGTHCFDDDIIWKNDGFVQAPQGNQQPCTSQLIRPHRRLENGELRVPPR